MKVQNFQKTSLTQSGLIINHKEPVYKATKKMTWLGIYLDLNDKRFSIPDKRILSIFNTITSVIQSLSYKIAQTLTEL